jgi:hypothetical protein
MGARSVRGASVGDAEGNTQLLHTGPIVVGSNAMAGPSDTGICLEGNTTTGQVWKLPSVNGAVPTIGTAVPGMLFYDTSRNVARMATELGFLAVGQSNGAATNIDVSNTTAETALRTLLHGAVVGARVYRWIERHTASNTSGASVTYTFRLRYATAALVVDSIALANNSSFHGVIEVWIFLSGTTPSSMTANLFSRVSRAAITGSPVSPTTLINQTAATVNVSSGFGVQSTVQMSAASANASGGSRGFLVEALAG